MCSLQARAWGGVQKLQNAVVVKANLKKLAEKLLSNLHVVRGHVSCSTAEL